MDNSNLDGCPYWIGNTCFKEVYKAIRSDTIDDCLSLMKSYDYNAYQNVKDSFEELKKIEDDSLRIVIQNDIDEENPNKEELNLLGTRIIESEDELFASEKEREDFVHKNDKSNEDTEVVEQSFLEKSISDQIKSNGYLCNKNISYSYQDVNDTLYLWTDIGFWKIIERDELFLLYHKNHFEKEAPFEAMCMGKFHRQADLGESKSLGKVVKYIIDHDRAKAIMKDDYRNLPQTTKKQKKYYRQAKKKATNKAIRRTDYLLSMLENGDLDQFKISI